MCVSVSEVFFYFLKIMNIAVRINYGNNLQAATTTILSPLCMWDNNLRSSFACSSDNLLFVICYYIIKGFFIALHF